MKQKILPTKLLRLNLFFIIGLLFIGGFSFAQGNAPDSPEGNGRAEIQEEHDSKNLDKLLKDYNQDQEKVLKDADKMLPKDDTTSELQESELSDEESLEATDVKPFGMKKKSGIFDPNFLNKKGPTGDLQKIKYSEAMKIALEPLQKMSERELIKLLLENTKGSSAGEYIDRYPKLAVFTVRLIKDKDALSSLAKVADDQKRSIRFMGIMISTILISFLLKRFMRKEGRPVLEAVTLWFLRFVLITTLRIGIILFFFSDEIIPTLKIVGITFF